MRVALVTMDGKTVKAAIVTYVFQAFAITEEQPTLHVMAVHASTHPWQLEHFVKTVIAPSVIITDIPMMHAHPAFVITDIQEISVIPVQKLITPLFLSHVFLKDSRITPMMLSKIVTL